MVDDVIAIDAGVENGVFFQGVHSGFNEEGHKAQFHAVFFFKFVLEFFAHFHDGCHIHFVESGEDGVGLLRLQQALGNACAQAAHGHALFRAIAQRDLYCRGRNSRILSS